MDTTSAQNKVFLIKKIYFYLVSFVALMMVVFSLGDLINTTLRIYVFTHADNFSYYPTMVCEAPAPSTIKDPNVKPLSQADCEKQNTDNQKRADEERQSQRERDLVRDISMIVVGLPLFALHWMGAKKKDQE
ncbi:MAG: hypothetical protein AAB849_02830 [Patescibacteria group bacterium]